MTDKRVREKTLVQKIAENKGVQSASTFVLPVLFGILLFSLWESGALHVFLNTDTFTLPLPDRIFTIMSDNRDKILSNVGSTIAVALIGLLAGSVIGYGIAVFAALFKTWGAAGLSIVAAFNAVPIVALAPVMTNLSKDISDDANTRSMVAKILVVMIVTIANMSFNAFRGLTELKPFAEDLMSTYAANRGVTLWKLRVPNSIPYIFIALRVAVPSSVISALVSEYFAEYIIGVGRQIRENIVLAQYSSAWAYIVTACLIGITMYVILMMIEGIVLKRRANA